MSGPDPKTVSGNQATVHKAGYGTPVSDRVSDRAQLKEEALKLGIDSRGLTPRQLREVVDDRKEAKKSMEEFINKTIDEREAARAKGNPPEPPKVEVVHHEGKSSSVMPTSSTPPKPGIRGSGGSASESGAFFTVYKSDVDDQYYLQGGSVSWGNGGGPDTIASYLVIDDTEVPVEADGTILYIIVDCEATISGGHMIPGCARHSSGAYLSTTPETNHAFTVASPTGFLCQEVGRWTSSGFLPSNVGNIFAGGCIGNFNLTRT